MKTPLVLVFAASAGLTLAAAAGESLKRDFEAETVGRAPAGFEFARTGNGSAGQWIVRAEHGADKNHVLVQEGADPTDYRFPVAVLKDGSYTTPLTGSGSRSKTRA